MTDFVVGERVTSTAKLTVCRSGDVNLKRASIWRDLADFASTTLRVQLVGNISLISSSQPRSTCRSLGRFVGSMAPAPFAWENARLIVCIEYTIVSCNMKQTS